MTAAGEGWLDVSNGPHIGMTYRPGDPLFLSEPAPDMKLVAFVYIPEERGA